MSILMQQPHSRSQPSRATNALPWLGGNSSGEGVMACLLDAYPSLGAVLEGKKTQAAASVAGAPVARDDLS